jgi:hypothetical protein
VYQDLMTSTIQMKKIWAVAAEWCQAFAAWCRADDGWDIDVVERTPGTRGFRRLPRRWEWSEHCVGFPVIEACVRMTSGTCKPVNH